MGRVNEFGQPIGEDVLNWQPAQFPTRDPMEGSFVRLVPVEPEKHSQGLLDAYSHRGDGRDWTYIPRALPGTIEETRKWTADLQKSEDPFFFAIEDKATGKPVGTASYLRMKPADGVIEVGYIIFSPLMQKKPSSTEVMYLMMRRVFDDWGYRRYEWKCDALNAPSRAAAERLGFTFEGVFRQATMYKGRNRDTAWFSVLDSEWQVVKSAFETWLSPDNFDEFGDQIESLKGIRARLST